MSDISFVETHKHPSETVTIIERWIPANKGEYAPLMVRPAGEDKYISMKLESRRTVDGIKI